MKYAEQFESLIMKENKRIFYLTMIILMKSSQSAVSQGERKAGYKCQPVQAEAGRIII